jgi:hypothetical protein
MALSVTGSAVNRALGKIAPASLAGANREQDPEQTGK